MKHKLLMMLFVMLGSLAITQAQDIDIIDSTAMNQLHQVYPLFTADGVQVNWIVVDEVTRCIEAGSAMYCDYMKNAVSIENVTRTELLDGRMIYTFKINRQLSDELDFDVSIRDLAGSIADSLPNILRMQDLDCVLITGDPAKLDCY